MFESRSAQDGDPLADAFAELPPDEEPPGYDPEFEAYVEILLAGHVDPSPADLDDALARGFEYEEIAERFWGDEDDIVEALLGRTDSDQGAPAEAGPGLGTDAGSNKSTGKDA